MRTIDDRRSQTAPDEPHSAYCRVCWRAVYTMWIDKEHHHGVCPNGALKVEDCGEARAAAEIIANLVRAGVKVA